VQATTVHATVWKEMFDGYLRDRCPGSSVTIRARAASFLSLTGRRV
jgi:hypothetical protein